MHGPGRHWGEQVRYDWTDTAVEHLKALLTAGATTYEIVARLPVDSHGVAPTRAAVCGKIDRLKLSGLRPPKPSHPKAEAARRRALKRKQAPHDPSRQVAQPTKRRPKSWNRPGGGIFAPAPLEANPSLDEFNAAIPEAQRITQVRDLNNRVCHWPVGDLNEPGFFFCGAATDKRPYCAFHAKIAFTPARKPVDQRPLPRYRRA